LLQQGEVNYMTMEGRSALADSCKAQEDIKSCRRQCRLIKHFFTEPDASICRKVKKDWQDECYLRAEG
jgi:hypothetical protein